MDDVALYPLRFEPIFKDYLWGGRRLAAWFPAAPPSGPLAEAWLVSDELSNPSRVAEGALKGQSLRDLMTRFGPRLLGRPAPANGRFPLLLKLLDAESALSVQVHPTDEKARETSPEAQGKTEAWVVLDAAPGACIYAGLNPGVDAARIRSSLRDKTMAACLHTFPAQPGDCVFLRAGTVHAIGAGLFIFEVQQTSDITYRLYDWDRVDARTGQSRPLHLEESLDCTNFDFGPCDPIRPIRESETRHRLVACPYFRLWRHDACESFHLGAAHECRIVIAVAGSATVTHGNNEYRLRLGDPLMLPADVGICDCRPHGAVTILECGLPE